MQERPIFFIFRNGHGRIGRNHRVTHVLRQEDITTTVDTSIMSEPFLGEIRMFGGNFAPRGWALCNGQLLAIAQNSALFSILGTTYGGNGQTNFGLPDLRGRAPVSAGQGPGLTPYILGQVGGTESVTLVETQMPIHAHQVSVAASIAIPVNTTNGASPTPSNASVLSQTSDTAAGAVVDIYSPGPGTTTLLPFQATASGTTGAAGGSQPFGILSPYLCVNFIIAVEGLFPSRN